VKAIVQRVRGKTSIQSTWDSRSEEHSFEGPGLVVLLAWEKCDEERVDLEKKQSWLIERIEGLRVFPDQEGKMNLSLSDYQSQNNLSEAGILWVSQFTLAAELKSGFRPSFTKAMNPNIARESFEELQRKLSLKNPSYTQIFGRFAAEMQLSFCNWGPVTIPLSV